MTPTFLLVASIVLIALLFDFINGFHDSANSIATIVATRVLSPSVAVLWAAFFNFAAAFLLGTGVASSIASGYIDPAIVTPYVVLAGLLGAIVWDLITWWLGLPTSSSHALIGGYAGAAIGKAGFATLVGGKWLTTISFIVLSPLIGMFLAHTLMLIVEWSFRRTPPSTADKYFRRLQLLSSALFSSAHGTNDAQKTMGIITLALFTGTTAGAFANLPPWLAFLHTPEFKISFWVKVLCALTMAAGTAAGGWRIMRTMGHKIVRLQPVHGFAAETTAGAIIFAATHFGIPLSTTHVISTSIMGVGAVKRFGAVKWGIVERILWAWTLTLPVCGFLGYGIERLCHSFGLH